MPLLKFYRLSGISLGKRVLMGLNETTATLVIIWEDLHGGRKLFQKAEKW
jgi:hypothetical protein